MSGVCLAALAVVAVLALLLQVRVGVRSEYADGKLSLWIRLWFIRIQVLPQKQRAKKKKRKKAALNAQKATVRRESDEQHEKKASPPKEQKVGKAVQSEKAERQPRETTVGDALAYVKTLLPLALEAAGQFRKKLRVDTLDLELRIGAHDPADVAIRYGQASAALGAAWMALTEAFDVKDGRVTVLPDFEAEAVSLSGLVELSLKIGQILRLGLYFGLRGLKKLIQVRKERKSLRKPVRKAV